LVSKLRVRVFRCMPGPTLAMMRYKKALGIRSTPDGFGAGGKWIWVLPPQPAELRAHSTRAPDAENSRQANAAANEADTLPRELQGRGIPASWAQGIASLDTIGHQLTFPCIGGTRFWMIATNSRAHRKTGQNLPRSLGVERTSGHAVAGAARLLGPAEPGDSQSRRPRRKMRDRGAGPLSKLFDSTRGRRSPLIKARMENVLAAACARLTTTFFPSMSLERRRAPASPRRSTLSA
jgi:hypothetical protein